MTLQAGSGSPSANLLLVEDDEAVGGILREILTRAGFEVEPVDRAAEAVDRLASRRYAAIVSDCHLLDLLPLDWLAALRGAAPTTPLILVSGLISVPDAHGSPWSFARPRSLRNPSRPNSLWRRCDARSTGDEPPPVSLPVEVLDGLPQRITTVRRRLGLSQRAFAKRLGTSGIVGRWERGAGMTVAMLDRIATAGGVPRECTTIAATLPR